MKRNKKKNQIYNKIGLSPLLFIGLLLLLNGCSKTPQIKFCEKFDPNNDLSRMWGNSKNIIEFDKLESGRVVMMILEKLPFGEIQITAIENDGEHRREAIVIPESFENNDPVAKLRAREIYITKMRTHIFSEKSDSEQLGDFDIYLHQNGEEIAKAKIIIK